MLRKKASGSLVQPACVVHIGEEQGDDAVAGNVPLTRDDQFIHSDIGDREDDTMTETSRTDDDPVGDAFRKVLDDSDIDMDEDQEDEIVWNPR
jgi:hypothetical protein